MIGARSVEQTEAHGLIEQLMICANERVAEQLERRGDADALSRPRAPRRRRGSPPWSRSSRRSTCPTPPLPETIIPERRGRAGRGGEPARRARGERRGHGRAAYTSLVLRSLKPAVYSDAKPRPRRARQPRVLSLHLADPPLSGPDRPPCAALRARRRGGRARARGGRARPADGARSASARRWRSSATPTASAPPFLLERELFESGPRRRFEGEVSGVIAAGAFVALRRRARRRLRGLPARRGGWAGERFDLDQTETAIVGASQRPRACGSATR